MQVAMRIALGVFAAALSAASANAGTITFADGNFGTEWSLSTYDDPAGGQAGYVRTDDGNPANTWEVSTRTDAYTASANLNSNFVYDPSSSGAIIALDIALQYRNFIAFLQGQEVYSVMARQAESIYVADYFTTGWNDLGWVSWTATGLTAGDFTLAAGAGTLDFSAGGAPIEFGFGTDNTNGYLMHVRYDNYELTLHTADVPLALALPLLASGVGALFFARRMRRN